MLLALTQRLLPALQLTRMALVFTAISNSLCSLLLALRRQVPDEQPLLPHIRLHEVILVALISIGLYGFGMSLNDIIDRRRDRQLAAHRPLPSGRIGLIAAHVICLSLAVLAILAATFYSRMGTLNMGYMSLAVALLTGGLIAFYDLAGKYLVGLGLLTLGLVRFFHAVIPAPYLPLMWHPLFLFTHVTLVSTLAYAWEEKRPPLTPLHWLTVLGGVLSVNGLAAASLSMRPQVQALHGLWPMPGLTLPLLAAGVFVGVAWHIYHSSQSLREAGQRLMLAGLLWLIVYDSAFVVAYVGVYYGVTILLLLPLSWLAVQFMRWWTQLMLMTQQPAYKRLRPGGSRRPMKPS
jgi:4-hydroxybenzoate polyprenyltransferase